MFKKLSIKSQLLITMLPVVFIVICALSFNGYRNAQKSLNNREIEKKENIKDGVEQFIDNYDLSLQIIEKDIVVRMEHIIDTILVKYTENLPTANLDSLQHLLKMDVANEDLYIIDKNNVVINTTKREDIGMDFNDFGSTYTNFLEEVRTKKTLIIERVANEFSTHTPKKFAYQSIDSNHILEIGIKYKDIDIITENFNSKLMIMSNRYSNIESINLFSGTEMLTAKNPLGEISEDHKNTAIYCYENKVDTTLLLNSIYTDYVFIEMRDAEYFNGYLLQIVTNDSLQKVLINKEFKDFFIILLLSLTIALIALLYITKKITKPIHLLTERVKKMAHSSIIESIDIDGSSETTTLSKEFNFLTSQVKTFQNELESKIETRTVELDDKNKSLNKLLLERDTLIKEIHHRVKNNLQIIASLLRLQSRNLKSEEAIEAFKNSITRIQAMALLHEKLYKNSNFISVNSQKYFSELVDLFKNTTPKNISIELLKSNINLSSSQAISVGLIINEFIANSLKHGFKDKTEGNILIELNTSQGILTLNLKNNGSKLPDNFDSKNQDSLGMTIIDSFTDKINGEFKYSNNADYILLSINFPIETEIN